MLLPRGVYYQAARRWPHMGAPQRAAPRPRMSGAPPFRVHATAAPLPLLSPNSLGRRPPIHPPNTPIPFPLVTGQVKHLPSWHLGWLPPCRAPLWGRHTTGLTRAMPASPTRRPHERPPLRHEPPPGSPRHHKPRAKLTRYPLRRKGGGGFVATAGIQHLALPSKQPCQPPCGPPPLLGVGRARTPTSCVCARALWGQALPLPLAPRPPTRAWSSTRHLGCRRLRCG